ncbi:MAG: hypothetical protein AAFN11_00180 [Chloroflexota bacterium]
MKSHFFSLLCFFLLTIAITAQETDETVPPVDPAQYPTHAALQSTELPPADPLDIAQRFLGVSIDEQANPVGREYLLGERDTFSITTFGSAGTVPIEFVLRGISDHFYIWVDPLFGVADDTVIQLGNRLDTDIYDNVRALWGSEPSPGVDGDVRLHMVISGRLNTNVAGYFSATNIYPISVAPASNERDMLVFNTLLLGANTQTEGLRVAAHEFQHMIHYVNDPNEDSWLDEGLATLTELLLGYDGGTFVLDRFANAPETSLTQWGTGNDSNADYGASMLFMLYLHDRFGLPLVQAIASDTQNDLRSIDNNLFLVNAPPVDSVIADWVLANLLRDTGTRFGYSNLPVMAEIDYLAEVTTLPTEYTRDLAQYGTHYYELSLLPTGERMISLTMPEDVALLPVSATSGNRVWYSQRGDRSNPSLTRAFDLRQVTSADLSFRLWHDLEADWDYGYISVSDDNGATWHVLTTPNMTTTNPNGRAYAIGYTGQSAGWLDETISLDAYTGNQILVRFEMITDDALHNAGIALDDVRIEAINYLADFEVNDGGWESDGWILSDNLLPQRAWVQIIAHTGEDYTITRHLATTTSTWSYTPPADSDRLTIAITPFASETYLPMSYTLQVD